MLQFTRIQMAAILVVVLIVCGLSIPNFVSEKTVASWPKWAQGRIALAPELQGGASILLEVDRKYVREHVLKNLFSDVRSLLRDGGIRSASPLAMRGNGVEVRPLSGDFDAALAKLGELSKAFHGVRAAEVTDAGGGLILVIPTEESIQEYERPVINRSIADIRARLFGLIGASANVEPEGPWRVRVQAPELGWQTLKQ